jgi:membrane protein YdbS with pleckstrin-like domain
MATLDDTFRPPTEEWVRLSPKLVSVRRLVQLLISGVLAIVLGVLLILGVVPAWLGGVLAAVLLVEFVWSWWLIGRRVRSYGYVERDDDLLVTSGILFRRLVVVPYGRLQLVDVVAGPLDRMYGIATVRLHTAAATTDATIPGLTPDTAAALRDRLAAKGESRGAGI